MMFWLARMFLAIIWTPNHCASYIYLEFEAMIEKNWVVQGLPEFGQQLEYLEMQGKISTQEHETLMKLYIGKSQKVD